MIKIPREFAGINGKEAYERIMNEVSGEKDNSENKNSENGVFEFKNSNIVKSDYIQIPGTGKVISKYEIAGHNNLNWQDTHFKLHENGLYMPVIPLFSKHFVNVIDSYNSNGKRPLFDANANPVSQKETKDIYNHLTKNHIASYEKEGGNQEGAWTWLDAFFREDNGMKILSEHKTIISNGNKALLPGKTEALENCLMEDCFSELIFNSQGLPTAKFTNQNYIQGKNIKFWFPRNGAVARFDADSGRASLYCHWVPSDRDSSLGVFAVAQAGS